jgi:glycosyltransferase involved in cell wall biosynthesis
MRVLQVSDVFPPAIGGLERHVATLSRRLVEAGSEVVVATMDYPGAATDEMVDGYRVVRLKGVSRFLRRFATDPGHYFHPTVPDPTLVRELQRLVDDVRPDVIHVHGWILESCVLLRRRPETALVVTLHEYGASCVKKTYTQTPTGCPTGPGLVRCIGCARDTYGLPKSVLLTAGLRAMRPLHARVDRWLAISTAVAEASAVALTVPVEEVDIVPTFVPDGIGTLVDSPIDFALPDEPFLLFVGAMGPHKGLGVLLDARERMERPAPLVVLGAPRADAPDLDRPGVFVHRNVPHAQVMACWAAATVGVVPSVWPEPLGQVAVECLAAGTPAVVTSTGGLGEVVRDGVEGLHVAPGDPVALAAALDRLLADPDLRRRLGAAGPARAKEFEVSSVLAKLLVSFERARDDRRAALGAR